MHTAAASCIDVTPFGLTYDSSVCSSLLCVGLPVPTDTKHATPVIESCIGRSQSLPSSSSSAAEDGVLWPKPPSMYVVPLMVIALKKVVAADVARHELTTLHFWTVARIP
jgi:hypothetical protein